MDALRFLAGARGRAPRPAYWITLIGGWGLTFAFARIADANDLGPVAMAMWYAIFAYVYLVVSACRSRDMGKSGWFALTTLIPLAGFIFALWLGFAGSSTWNDDDDGLETAPESRS